MTTRRFTISANGAAVAADGGTDYFICNGRAVFSIRGSFGGGTLKAQGKIYKYYDGSLSTNSDYADISESPDYQAPCVSSIDAAFNAQYRFNLSGATAPSLIIDVEVG